MFRYIFAVFIVGFSAFSQAISIDGVADEPEWIGAQTIEDFYVVDPFLLSEPELRTEAKIFSDSNGIYVAITSFQDQSEQRWGYRDKDEVIQGDSVRFTIDFDAAGKTAYEFEIGNGGGLREGVLQSGPNHDSAWDGSWQGASQVKSDRWVAELFIPWDVAPMVKVKQAFRQVGVHIERRIVNARLRVASAPIQRASERFIANFPMLEVVNRREASRIKAIAYGVAKADLLDGKSELEPGVEAYWQAENKQQHLALGVKPNFVGVLPDKLVLNFSPMEVFFPERRSLFADNNQLFDLGGNKDLRLLHSRRIGAPHDFSAELSLIDLAMKYSKTSGRLNFGILAAEESDSDIDQGKSFAAGRARYKWGNLQGGLLSTYVKQADQDRKALTHSIDLTYQSYDHIVVNGLLAFSDIEDEGATVEEDKTSQQGVGMSLRATQQITDNWSHQFDFMRYEKDFQVNDLGFLPRADLQGFSYRTNLNTFASRSNNLEFSTELINNIDGLNLYRIISLNYGESLPNSAAWQLVGSYRSPGHDDLITRGNLTMKTDEGFLFGAVWQGKSRERFYYQVEANYQDIPIEGKGYYAALKPGFNFNERLSLHMDVVYFDRQAWNTWQEDNLVNSHQRKQFYTDINFIAQLSGKQKLQLSLQWIALAAKAEFGGELASNGALVQDQRQVDDFNIADTAFQLRYSYQLSPQAEALLVYRRAGHYGENYLAETDLDQTGYASPFGSFANGWRQRSIDNLLVKLSWAF